MINKHWIYLNNDLEWSKYELSILVGAGIGVTPFASIIKELFNSLILKQYPDYNYLPRGVERNI